jgi:flagellin
MAQVINTNVLSLNAQRNLNRSQNDLGVAMQRIASGLRINSAKDDAAGLAISDRLTAQIRGMNQATRNAADAISLAQTGEGSLQEITNNLQRMRELSVQSRNATNTASDRQSLDAEFQQLLSEIDRLAETTAFNGRKILDGSLGASVFQVGANVGETISVDVSSSMRTDAIGNYATVSYSMVDRTDQTANTAVALAALNTNNGADTLSLDVAGELVINGTNVAAATDGANGQTDGSAYALANAINASEPTHGVTATATASSVTFTAAQIGNGLNFTEAGTNDTLVYTMSLNGTQVFSQGEGDTALSATQLASAINGDKTTHGVSATVAANGDLTLTANDGRNIDMTESISGSTAADADAVVGYFGNTLTVVAGQTTFFEGNVYKGGIDLASASSISLDFNDDDGGDLFTTVADGATGVNTQASTIDQSNILTENAADASIYRIDQAINDVDVLRGTFGSIQSRFESTIASLQTAVENQSAARSRIQDADFAEETSRLTRAQILQQAGTAILSQANAVPQSVLALLQ